MCRWCTTCGCVPARSAAQRSPLDPCTAQPATWACDRTELACVPAGEKRKASLLSRTEPSLWYVAAAGIPALPADAVAAAAAAELTEAELKARKAVAERALETEAVIFEQELGEVVCSVALRHGLHH